MTKQQQAKAEKLIILVRYTVKQAAVVGGVFYPAGSVVLKVRNYKGDEYYVTLRRNKIHSCTCPHIPSEKCPECYHIIIGKRTENARIQATHEARKQVLQQQEGLVQAPNGNWVTPEHLANVPVARDVNRAPLNGNRAFSILK